MDIASASEKCNMELDVLLKGQQGAIAVIKLCRPTGERQNQEGGLSWATVKALSSRLQGATLQLWAWSVNWRFISFCR